MKVLNKKILEANIEKIAEYDFDNQKVFGSAYAVIQNGELIYKKYFGYINLITKENITGDTLFRLASMTKPITAFATLILVDRGLISLSDKVSKYLPEFENIHIKQIDDKGNYIDLGLAKAQPTIRDLLTHTSGIGNSKSGRMSSDDKSTVDNSVSFFSKVGLDFEPFSKQDYSGFAAFDVLVKIIEKITNTDYESFLNKEIFKPCGMTNTVFVPNQKQWNNLIAMHNKVEGKCTVAEMKENCIFEDFPCTHFVGGAGLASTLDDYLKFAKMLLNNGVVSEKRLVSEETFKLLSTPWVSEDIMPGWERWGLGVRVITNESYPNLPVGAFGWSGAYGSHFWIDPVNKIAAVFMKNSKFDGGAGNESAQNFEKAVKDSFILPTHII
jgi:CubicO group peptidase (beta-lactamase class C family)